ncbi:glycosyltransferase family 9 protein [Blastococcus brunescens]|uniref:Glycosyltransferase family 9 protein n=1 Tax=Blastococcus brunescens TaxID=1564165 RepID=A0ABZ1BB45_9ACTN|nr:glycosyltransferase family 9 protein [Blastococcus sp. BMG 8361]WRL67278.1 glycosyltransferase family 9 protein [Blastococcus sp. BMG 8361]
MTAAVAGTSGADLGGATTLAQMAALLDGAAAVVVGNTGPAHLAAAVGTPVVSLFAPVVPAQRWAPYGVPTVLLGDQSAPCRNTRARECPVPGHPCLTSVTAHDVVAAVEKLVTVEQPAVLRTPAVSREAAVTIQGEREDPRLARARLLDDGVRPGRPRVPDPGDPGPEPGRPRPCPHLGLAGLCPRGDPEALRGEEVDVVVLQRTRDLDLVRAWLGREPGRDLPAVFLEHNAPGLEPEDGPVPHTRHPLADRDDIPIAHVTHFNRLFYDNGRAPTTVIEHGIVDPGERYTGELARAAVVVNEPVRRGRTVGADLLPGLAQAAPLDVFGMGLTGLHEQYGLDPGRVELFDDPPQAAMHAELARRRVYVHPVRWTSLGLSLLEAMHLGMPVVGLATTEAVEAVPFEAGCCPPARSGWRRRSGTSCTTRTPPGWPARRRVPSRWSGTGFPGSSATGMHCSRR